MDPRRTLREETIVPVRIWGMDANGQPFIEVAFTRNVSPDGAWLEGVPRRLKPGDILGITFQQKKSRLRVVWVGQAGSPDAGRVGLQALAGGNKLATSISNHEEQHIRPIARSRSQAAATAQVQYHLSGQLAPRKSLQRIERQRHPRAMTVVR